ncbi:uncharacterized protein LOC144359146 [Saccoglossus kowalevskii]
MTAKKDVEVRWEGYLTKSPNLDKKSSGLKEWTKRWFVFYNDKGNPILSYYRDEHAYKQKKRSITDIQLKDCEAITHLEHFEMRKYKRQNVICIEKAPYKKKKTEERRTFYLIADTKEDMDAWYAALEDVLVSLGVMERVEGDGMRKRSYSHSVHSTARRIPGTKKPEHKSAPPCGIGTMYDQRRSDGSSSSSDHRRSDVSTCSSSASETEYPMEQDIYTAKVIVEPEVEERVKCCLRRHVIDVNSNGYNMADLDIKYENIHFILDQKTWEKETMRRHSSVNEEEENYQSLSVLTEMQGESSIDNENVFDSPVRQPVPTPNRRIGTCQKPPIFVIPSEPKIPPTMRRQSSDSNFYPSEKVCIPRTRKMSAPDILCFQPNLDMLNRPLPDIPEIRKSHRFSFLEIEEAHHSKLANRPLPQIPLTLQVPEQRTGEALIDGPCPKSPGLIRKRRPSLPNLLDDDDLPPLKPFDISPHEVGTKHRNKSCKPPLPPARNEEEYSKKLKLLQADMWRNTGIIVKVKKSYISCRNIALVSIARNVWIAGWKSTNPIVKEYFNIGDKILAINGVYVKSVSDAYAKIEITTTPEVEVKVARLPLGELYTLKKTEKEDWGIVLKTMNVRFPVHSEITQVVINGIAHQAGLKHKCNGISGRLCNWAITEINLQPLGLSISKKDVRRLLDTPKTEISLLVQPCDFVMELKKQLQAMPNYFQYNISLPSIWK